MNAWWVEKFTSQYLGRGSRFIHSRLKRHFFLVYEEEVSFDDDEGAEEGD